MMSLCLKKKKKLLRIQTKRICVFLSFQFFHFAFLSVNSFWLHTFELRQRLKDNAKT